MAARLSRSAPCAGPKASAHRPCRSRRRRRSCSRQQRCSCTRPANMGGHRARWAGAAGKECPPVQKDAFARKCPSTHAQARRTQTQRPQELQAWVPTGVAGMRTGLHVMHAAGDGSRAPRSAHGWLAGRPVTLQRSWSTPQPSSPPTHRPSAHLPDGQMLPLQQGLGLGWGGGRAQAASILKRRCRLGGQPMSSMSVCLQSGTERLPLTSCHSSAGHGERRGMAGSSLGQDAARGWRRARAVCTREASRQLRSAAAGHLAAVALVQRLA